MDENVYKGQEDAIR